MAQFYTEMVHGRKQFVIIIMVSRFQESFLTGFHDIQKPACLAIVVFNDVLAQQASGKRFGLQKLNR